MKHLTQYITNKVPKTFTSTIVKKWAIVVLTTWVSLSQMACSSNGNSAEQSSRYTSSDHQYAYQKSVGSKSVFSPITLTAGKQDFQSDRQLMVALLNREPTEDQTLMQGFTQAENNPYYVGYTSIRGPRVNTPDNNYIAKRTRNFGQSIVQDQHVVSIRGR
jgi:hypothetical protein